MPWQLLRDRGASDATQIVRAAKGCRSARSLLSTRPRLYFYAGRLGRTSQIRFDHAAVCYAGEYTAIGSRIQVHCLASPRLALPGRPIKYSAKTGLVGHCRRVLSWSRQLELELSTGC